MMFSNYHNVFFLVSSLVYNLSFTYINLNIMSWYADYIKLNCKNYINLFYYLLNTRTDL